MIKSIDGERLAEIRAARAAARERAWDAGARPETITLALDATLLDAHSDKEEAAGNYKGGFGFHPLLCYLDETGEALAGLLRAGNAGANSAADHFEVLEAALEQIPEADLDREILATHAFSHNCRSAGIGFSVGYAVDDWVREAILALPESAWEAAIDAEGEVREGAWVAELSDRLELSEWPEGTPGDRPPRAPAPRSAVRDLRRRGLPLHALLTDQQGTEIAALELRHRRRARVEDAIRTGKECGMRNLPFSSSAANRVWLELSLAAQDLLSHSCSLCLDGELARRAEAASPAPPARRRADRALGAAGEASPASLVALGRGAPRRLPAAALVIPCYEIVSVY